ncbi:MAG: serine/threonine-protein kinase [Polyangiaceae bacterium]
MMSNTEPVPPPSPGPSVGMVIASRYRLDQELASGGMGKVFRALHVDLKIPVALKVLHGFMASSEEAMRRFYREARAASLLAHPNVVKVTDYGTHDGRPFLVMELVDGESMEYWLSSRDRPPALADVREAMMQLTRGVGASHAAGIVHRDLKPSNVMQSVLADGSVLWKIADFGLAHLDDPRDYGNTLTQPDAVAGTPDYMSPEQCRSLKVGPSTDLYALGCILTELLQLEPPFWGASAIDVISQHMFSPPPPLNRPADAEPVPELVERLRLALLAKRPHERPKTAAEVLEALEGAFDPAENARRLPDRKGETPMGARAERHPEWLEAGAATHTKACGTVRLVRGASAGSAGIDSDALTALRAQGFEVSESVEDGGPAPDILLYDAGSDLAQALERLEGTSCPVVVCAEGLGAAETSTFIEAGAADVICYPVRGDILGRRLLRLLRKKAIPSK